MEQNLHQGILLTSHFFDTPKGLRLCFYGKDFHGPFQLNFYGQKIVFFVPSDSDFNPGDIRFERKSGGLKNFSHKPVDTIYLEKYSDVAKVKNYCQVKGLRTFELDVLPTERFLMERFISGTVEFQGSSSVQNGVRIFNEPQIRPGKRHPELTSLSLDIETGVGGELYSVGLYFESSTTKYEKVIMLADENRTHDDLLELVSTEKQVLEKSFELINKWDPDFLIGWHVVGFDLKFIEKKCIENQMDFKIGRLASKVHIEDKKGIGSFADIPGRIILDGPPVLRSAFYQFKNFKLETVAREVIGEGKDIGSDGGKVSEIERRFKEDKPALAKYNILDCILVTQIFNKLNIFDFMIKRVCISGLLFDRLAVSTAAFDHVFLPRLHRKGFVAPNRIDIVREDASTGGLVLEPVVGLHKKVAVFDFKSLYPSIIRTFNIDPYSKIQGNINTLKTPNGTEFSGSEHILPGIIEYLLEQRQVAKEQKNASLSQAVKILMNSFYGVMGSTRCRFYHADLPTAITTSGHWVLRAAMNFFENRGHEVLYGDTDSVFISLTDSHLAQKNYCEDLASEVNIFLKKLVHDEFKVVSALECEYEKTFDQLFFSKARSGEGGAKKRYAGIQHGEIEFKGMEFVRSDWTELAKMFQMEIYQKFFAGEELESTIKEYIKALESGIYDDQLVYTKRLSKAPEEYTKNIPIHVKAALKVNHTGPYRLKEVSYIVTKSGPEPIQHNPTNPDYGHYIEKQLKPIADDLLQGLGKSFDSLIVGDQLTLF